MKLTFPKNPPIGFEMAVDGQSFLFDGVDPHQRQDGSSTGLMVWRSHCHECGVEFVARSPLGRGPEVRRCSDHRKPGVRARASSEGFGGH